MGLYGVGFGVGLGGQIADIDRPARLWRRYGCYMIQRLLRVSGCELSRHSMSRSKPFDSDTRVQQPNHLFDCAPGLLSGDCELEDAFL